MKWEEKLFQTLLKNWVLGINYPVYDNMQTIRILSMSSFSNVTGAKGVQEKMRTWILET